MNVLLTAAGSPGASTFISEIKKYFDAVEIHGCDMNGKNDHGLNNFFTCLKGTDPGYCAQILEYCIKKNIQLLIPCSDEEILSIYSESPEFLKNNIKQIKVKLIVVKTNK